MLLHVPACANDILKNINLFLPLGNVDNEGTCLKWFLGELSDIKVLSTKSAILKPHKHKNSCEYIVPYKYITFTTMEM